MAYVAVSVCNSFVLQTEQKWVGLFKTTSFSFALRLLEENDSVSVRFKVHVILFCHAKNRNVPRKS